MLSGSQVSPLITEKGFRKGGKILGSHSIIVLTGLAFIFNN